MFFIDRDSVRVVVRPEEAQFNAQGRKIKTLKRRVFAQFQRGIPDWVVPIATEHLDFSYLPPEEPVIRACAFYDSEADQIQHNWTAEEREAIEARLIASGYFQVEKVKAPLPYAAYLKHRKVHGKRTVEHAITDIKATLDLTGEGPEAIFAYERDHEDEHSAAIVTALQEPQPKAEADEELVTA